MGSQSIIRLRPLLLAAGLCALLTLPAAWKSREAINPDGLSYIDIASNAVHLSPSYIVSNAYWSPLYPALIAVTMKLTHASLASELAVVHGLDWLICLFVYLCYTCFLYNLLRWIDDNYPAAFQTRTAFYAMVALAYVLLLVGNIEPELWLIGPNVLVEGFIYLAAGLCLRTSLSKPRLVHYVAFGITLAFAYASKAALFPLSLALLVILIVWPPGFGERRKGIVIAAVAFLLASSPLIAVLSHYKGRVTFGDAGVMNYAWRVNELHAVDFWTDRIPGGGAPLHRPKVIATDPMIVKFDLPVPAAFPFWYDPSYWWEGVRTHFNIAEQLRIYRGDLGLDRQAQHDGVNVFELFKRWVPLFLGLGVLPFLGLSIRGAVNRMRSQAWLLIWPLLAFLMFASVVLEFRYVFPFILIGFTWLFVVSCTAIAPRNAPPLLLTVAAILLAIASPDIVRPAGRFVLERLHPSTPGSHTGVSEFDVAEQLKRLGIRPGDDLAAMNFPSICYYSRLTGTTLTLRVYLPDHASSLPAPKVVQILDALRANGARAAVSLGRPAFDNDSGWVHVGDSFLYLRML